MKNYILFGNKNIKRYIYREMHNVYVDYEIELNDEQLVEAGISPYDDIEISEYIRSNYLKLQPNSTEWWISAQEQSFEANVGIRPDDDDSENSIKWM
jgi:hypothetical protein